ncbi:Hypothetical predicted protein [Podarcis lilfordi]|uniref:Uncharacterized protein n=1 Tax=Podarcis lilfordi TaxID=74358 RepID=A0AA35KBA8_9SAUR|nr:Hypothetical predicted protein [Podarcis lilfordi]
MKGELRTTALSRARGHNPVSATQSGLPNISECQHHQGILGYLRVPLLLPRVIRSGEEKKLFVCNNCCFCLERAGEQAVNSSSRACQAGVWALGDAPCVLL